MNRRICFVGTEITPSEGNVFVGGHVNTVVGLCKGLSKLGWDIHIVTTPSRFTKERTFNYPWATIHLIKTKYKYGSFMHNITFLLNSLVLIRKINGNYPLDLVHAHSGFFIFSLIPFLIRKHVGLPAFFSLYCPLSSNGFLLFDEIYMKVISSGLDKIIAVTNNVKISLLDKGIQDYKLEVIPSCIDERFYERSHIIVNKEDNMVNSKTPTILFVGNIDNTKGLDVFLNAAEIIMRKKPLIKWIITLHESSEIIKRTQIMCEKRLGSSVIVMGIVENMVDLLANISVLVIPFRSTYGISDIPLIVLEAMASGKPVVASKLDGIEEVIINGENGLLSTPGNVEEIAMHVLTILEDKKLAKNISEKAAVSVFQYTYTEISRKMKNSYEKELGVRTHFGA